MVVVVVVVAVVVAAVVVVVAAVVVVAIMIEAAEAAGGAGCSRPSIAHLQASVLRGALVHRYEHGQQVRTKVAVLVPIPGRS